MDDLTSATLAFGAIAAGLAAYEARLALALRSTAARLLAQETKKGKNPEEAGGPQP